MKNLSLSCLIAFFLLAVVSACAFDARKGDDAEFGFSNHAGDDDAAGLTDDDESGDVHAVYDYVLIDGEPAPPNPVSGAGTPDEFNKIPLFRFHAEFPPPEIRAVVILQAGFCAGANQMFFIARNLVEMSRGAVEVWIPERRHTLLEDQRGMDVAEAVGDPWIAYNYYLNGVPLDGATYRVPDPFGPETDMMSEWGLDLWLHDLRRVIDLVPEEHRRTNVFLAGDSRGVAFTQAFAAYEFEDGSIGADHLAGLILWDGGVRPNPDLNGFNYPRSIEKIRKGRLSRMVQLQTESFWFMEIFGLVASEGLRDAEDKRLGPNGFFPDYGPFTDIIPLLMRFHHSTLTNEAFVGILLDSDYVPYPDYMGHLGRLTGGKLRRDFLGEHPAENGKVYSWMRWNECDPPEFVDTRKLVKMLYEGPSNFSDFHYSSRLDLDLQAADYFETEGTWRHDYFHFYTSRVDVPVFAMNSILYAGLGLMEKYRDEIAPVRGATGPRTRDEFKILYQLNWSHLDAIAAEASVNPVLPKLLKWIDEWAVGTVVLPDSVP